MARANKSRLPFYVETVPGVEEIAWLEIRERLAQAEFEHFLFAKNERGVVVFSHSGLIGDLFKLRTVRSAFLVAVSMPELSRANVDLRDMAERIAGSGELGRAANALTRYRQRQIDTYRLVVRKYGRHQYSREQLRKSLIVGIERVKPAWRRARADADVDIWVNLFGSHLLVGLHLPPPRWWRRDSDRTAAVPDTLAAAMVWLTTPDADDSFLDPLCGAGTILGERVAAGPVALALGGEIDVATAVERVGEHAALARWHPGTLPLAAGSADGVATFFPDGTRRELFAQYSAWLGEIGRVLRPGQQAVILTAQYELFKDVIREHPRLEIRTGYSVAIGKKWGRIYVLERA